MKRAKTPSYALMLKLNTSKHDERILVRRFLCGQRIYNVLVRHCVKQLKNLRNDKQYQELLAIYIKNKKNDMDNSHISKLLNKIVSSYGLTEYQLHSYVVLQQHRYKKDIDSSTAQKIGTAVWKAVENVLYGDGKRIHFKKYDDFLTMEGKTNNTGIRYKDGKMIWNKLTVSVQHDKNDIYQQLALKNKVKYCRIKRMTIGTKYHYYIELVLEGIPPIKHIINDGETGLDIGTSTVAVVSSDGFCKLDVLADSAASIEKEQRKLLRKLDRSRRATNPDNYNPDGTVKKGKLKWNKSNTYKKTYIQYKNICRKRAAVVKQSHEMLANEILEHGSTVRSEKMSFKGLKKRSKETKKNSKGKICSKKRFGKSIQSRAPAMLLDIINRKLQYVGKSIIYINTRKFKASQYNHTTDVYKKKKLSSRYTFVDNHKVQRDLYSAFLIMNSNNTNDSADRQKCMETFNQFCRIHDNCIQKLISNNRKYPLSMGLKYFVTC